MRDGESRLLPLAMLVIAMALLFLVMLPSGPPDYPEFRAELANLQGETTPPSGRVLTTSEPMIQNGSLRATWEIESGMAWSEYTDWASRELTRAKWIAPSNTTGDSESRSFIMTMSGETFVLELQSGSAPSRVRLVFKVIPN